ncbi:MAG TPA: thymidine kinase [Phycisphaerae bacterium]
MNKPTAVGRIEVIQGSMFSGKTEELIARLRAAQRAGLTVRAFKHHIDDRYDPDHLITHRHDRFDALRVPDAEAIARHRQDAQVIGIDEGHFFGEPLVAVTRRLAAEGRRVVIVGLAHDAWGRPFAPMPQLAALAADVTCKYAPCCICGAVAVYSQRMVAVTDRCMVGGADAYEPRCAEHFQPLPDPSAA